jgi:hypothetical protein
VRACVCVCVCVCVRVRACCSYHGVVRSVTCALFIASLLQVDCLLQRADTVQFTFRTASGAGAGGVDTGPGVWCVVLSDADAATGFVRYVRSRVPPCAATVTHRAALLAVPLC